MRTWLALALGAALLLVGCGHEDDGSSGSGPSSYAPITLPPPPPGITMSFLQQRIWEGTRRADLRIANHTDEELEVRRVGVRWPGFPGGTQRRAVRVGPGAVLDLHYRLPQPDCTADPATPATGIAVTGRRTVRRAVDEAGMRFLTRLWTEACARRRVARLLDVSWSVPRPDDAGRIPAGGGLDSTLPVELVLARRPGSDAPPVALASVLGTVLFDLTAPASADGPAVPVLGAGQQEARVPVTVDPGRCDEHARSQASQPFTFRMGLLIGDATAPASVVVRPDAEGQRRLLRFLDLACAGITRH